MLCRSPETTAIRGYVQGYGMLPCCHCAIVGSTHYKCSYLFAVYRNI